MREFTGRLSLNGRVVAEGVRGRIAEGGGPRPSWGGSIELPPAVGAAVLGWMCRLDTDGAESFDVVLTRYDATSGTGEFRCKGGPLRGGTPPPPSVGS